MAIGRVVDNQSKNMVTLCVDVEPVTAERATRVGTCVGTVANQYWGVRLGVRACARVSVGMARCAHRTKTT